MRYYTGAVHDKEDGRNWRKVLLESWSEEVASAKQVDKNRQRQRIASDLRSRFKNKELSGAATLAEWRRQTGLEKQAYYNHLKRVKPALKLDTSEESQPQKTGQVENNSVVSDFLFGLNRGLFDSLIELGPSEATKAKGKHRQDDPLPILEPKSSKIKTKATKPSRKRQLIVAGKASRPSTRVAAKENVLASSGRTPVAREKSKTKKPKPR